MAVTVVRVSLLMGYINNGKDDSHDSRNVNAYEHIM